MAIFNLSLCLLHMLFILAVIPWAGIQKTDKKVIVDIKLDGEYCSPKLDSVGVYLAEHFDDEQAFKERWIQHDPNEQSDDENAYKSLWDIQPPLKKLLNNDLGLVILAEGTRTSISTLLDKPFEFNEKPLVVQYEVTWQEDQKCGGAYIVLLSEGGKITAEFAEFFNQYLYTILFGPEKCGNSNNLHFVFRYENPEDSNTAKSFYKKLSHGLESYYDRRPHLYTLIIRSDNTYTILIDYNVIIHESFPEDFNSHVDTSGKKDYRFTQVAPIYSVGFALWVLTPMILFDNVLVTDEPSVAQQWAARTFALKHAKICSESDYLNSNANITTDEYCLKSKVELDTEGCSIERRILHECNKADSEIDLHTTYTESQLERGLKCTGIVLGSFLFVGLVIFVWCGPKSGLDAELKKIDVNAVSNADINVESKNYSQQAEIGSNAQSYSRQAETNAKAKSDLNLLIINDAKAKSDMRHLGVGERGRTDTSRMEFETDRSDKEEEFSTENETAIKDDMSKANLKNLETEQINSGDKRSLEGEQKCSDGGNLWLYAGVIVGSFISLGVATYMWSGSKSKFTQSADAKRKKADTNNRCSKAEKIRKEKKSTVIKSKEATVDKAEVESTTTDDDSHEEIEESDAIGEEDSCTPSIFEDEISKRRGKGPTVIKSSSKGGSSGF